MAHNVLLLICSITQKRFKAEIWTDEIQVYNHKKWQKYFLQSYRDKWLIIFFMLNCSNQKPNTTYNAWFILLQCRSNKILTAVLSDCSLFQKKLTGYCIINNLRLAKLFTTGHLQSLYDPFHWTNWTLFFI